MKKIVIAIDGPAGAGKSTTARLVAKKLGYLYIDTGAMYRAVTLKVLLNNIDELDSTSIDNLLMSSSIELVEDDNLLKVILDKVDVTEEIRSPRVTNAVSAVSALENVRKKMVSEQRKLGMNGGVVLEGRDIGTVVFPNAELKIFLNASIEERAKRRGKDLSEAGIFISQDSLSEQLQLRDTKDSTRSISPFKKATDAIELDTTLLTLDQQVEFIVLKAKEIIQS